MHAAIALKMEGWGRWEEGKGEKERRNRKGRESGKVWGRRQ